MTKKEIHIACRLESNTFIGEEYTGERKYV